MASANARAELVPCSYGQQVGRESAYQTRVTCRAQERHLLMIKAGFGGTCRCISITGLPIRPPDSPRKKEYHSITYQKH